MKTENMVSGGHSTSKVLPKNMAEKEGAFCTVNSHTEAAEYIQRFFSLRKT